MPTCLVLQHVRPECSYAIGDALAREGVALEVRRMYAGDRPPADLDGVDAVVVMGGPMSATSDAGFPTRTQEIAMLRQALDAGVPILGVCLGAQLLAAAAGATVRPGDRGAEIGWGSVRLSAAADEADPLFEGVGTDIDVLHWHGDTFDLPPEAILLASSERYRNQAFRLGAHAWGLQFHLEVDADAVAAFCEAFGEEARGHGVDPAAITAATPGALGRLEAVQRLVLGRFASLVVVEATRVTTQVVF